MQGQWIERRRWQSIGNVFIGVCWGLIAASNYDEPGQFWFGIALTLGWFGIAAHAVAYEAPSIVTADDDGLRIQRGRRRDWRLHWDQVRDIRDGPGGARGQILVETATEEKPIKTGLYGTGHPDLLSMWRSRSSTQGGSS